MQSAVTKTALSDFCTRYYTCKHLDPTGKPRVDAFACIKRLEQQIKLIDEFEKSADQSLNEIGRLASKAEKCETSEAEEFRRTISGIMD